MAAASITAILASAGIIAPVLHQLHEITIKAIPISKSESTYPMCGKY